MRRYILIFPLIVILLASCSLSKFGWESENGKESPSIEKKGIVEDWDPLTLKEEEVKVTPVDTVKAVAPKTNSQPQQSPIATLTAPLDEENDDQVTGFRVQLLTSSSETAAREEKSKAMLRFNEKVYLIFDAQYKVRIGDFLTYDEAKPLRNLAIQKGYPDAFIVRTKVNKPPAAAIR